MFKELKEFILGEKPKNEVESDSFTSNLEVGKNVIKTKGYPFPGIIVSKFTTTSGAERFVVECTSPGVKGCLHIFNADQIVSLN